MSGGTSYHAVAAPADHTRRKSQMVTALAELDTNEDFWPTIVSRISDGEFLSTIAGELKVNHSILRNWIRGSKPREQAYAEAERAGKQHRINMVLKKTYETAVADVADPATRMEQLRAAEILLKQQDEAKAPPSAVANIQINFVAASDGKPKGEVIEHPVP